VAAFHAAAVSTPLYTGPEGESPAVRTIAGVAATNGLHMVLSRMTSEADAASFAQFERRLADMRLGPTDAGVKNAKGQEIRQSNDRDFFAYDAVNLVIAALKKQASASPGAALIKAIGAVRVTSANGDTRGFNPQNHEGVSDDDMYIAVLHDMQFEPVKDEPLSASLPAEDQILSDFH
jgi:ABC-type branched-subunit amino acid transport system substrate-binding protein